MHHRIIRYKYRDVYYVNISNLVIILFTTILFFILTIFHNDGTIFKYLNDGTHDTKFGLVLFLFIIEIIFICLSFLTIISYSIRNYKYIQR